jgi:hypothetical protein
MNRRQFLQAGAGGSIALLTRVGLATPLQFNQIYSLRCLGNVNGPRYLDGRTADGTVGLVAKLVKPFSGTKWRLVNAGNGTVAFQCRGDVEGRRWLDGRTADGTVGLAPNTGAPFTGTRWQIIDVPGGVTLKCLGAIEGSRWLDGRTGNGSVGLAKTTDPPFTGTKWEIAPYPVCFDDPCNLP